MRANIDSPYFAGLAEVLVKAFGPPRMLAEVLRNVDNIVGAYIYGSWAARFTGDDGDRPVGDIDVLVLGSPDRNELYAGLSNLENRLGRAIQITMRDPGWLDTGTGNFHATVTDRPIVEIDLTNGETGPTSRSR